MEKQNKVRWVYSSRSNQELARRYDRWAEDYDADLKRDFEYRAPEVTAEVFARYVPKEAGILDAGAGTGMVGEVLTKLGYANLVAMDLSQGMLEVARQKNVYQELHQMIMGEVMDYASDSFDAIVCVGTLGYAHAPASSLDELVRITRPGGYIVYTLRPDVYKTEGYKEKQTALETEGKWRLLEVSDNIQMLPKGEPDLYHQIWVYQVI